MKKIIIVSLFALSLGWAAQASAGQGLYVGGNVGVAMVPDVDIVDPAVPGDVGTMSYDSGVALSGALGYAIQNIRFEAEFAWQQNDLDSLELMGWDFPLTGDVEVISGMVNGYFEIPTGSPWKPFVTGGLGMARVEMNDFNAVDSGAADWSGDDTVFAWQVGAGVGYAINERATVEVRYRYFATDDAEFDDGSTLEFASHNISLGLRLTF